MADFSVTGNWFVYPTYGTAGKGAGNVPYQGSYHDELVMEILLAALAGSNNRIFSGFAVPGSSGDLTLAVPLGVAVIAGRVVTVPGSTTLTLAASHTNYIFLKLQRDSTNYVISAAFEVNITGTPPADSVAIASAVAGSSSISSTIDMRPLVIPKGTANRMKVYSAAGSFSFVPQITGKHKVLLVGGGGCGGAGHGYLTTTTNYASGGGAGSGAFTLGSVDLTAGVAVTGTVGAGGINSTDPPTPQDGQASTFGSLTANGGHHGGVASNTVGGTAGAGGAASTVTSTVFSLKGGDGVAGSNAAGGASLPGGAGGNSPGMTGWIGPKGNTNFNPEVSAAGVNVGTGGAGGVGEYNSPFNVGISTFTSSWPGAAGLVIIFW